jgi:hypothetical protein
MHSRTVLQSLQFRVNFVQAVRNFAANGVVFQYFHVHESRPGCHTLRFSFLAAQAMVSHEPDVGHLLAPVHTYTSSHFEQHSLACAAHSRVISTIGPPSGAPLLGWVGWRVQPPHTKRVEWFTFMFALGGGGATSLSLTLMPTSCCVLHDLVLPLLGATM